MSNRKLGNVVNLGNFGIFFRVFFFRVFDFEYWIKIEKSEEKKSEINFRGFRVFDLAEESFNVT